jgi:PleD family two-component response regulator
MVLAIVDDLMFASKIRSTAAQLGVPVTFARSSASALASVRDTAPSLVILDLNNPRTDPLGTVAVLKADAATSAIRTVGYVSHAQTDLIEAARQAGVDEVMARSAFTAKLADILAGAGGERR